MRRQEAITYLLGRIRDDERLYFLLGAGSQSFDLLTEAYSALTCNDLETVRKNLAGVNA